MSQQEQHHDDGSVAGFPRRSLFRAGAVLLASAGFGALTPGGPAAAAPGARSGTRPVTAAPDAGADLARFRPVTVSSTDYGPVPAHFAVDGLPVPGVRGSGWRADDDNVPQWLAVDLQGRCEVSSVRLVFSATEGDAVFTPADDVNPRNGTTGWEVLASYATDFRIEASDDGTTWTPLVRGSTAVGGVVDVELDAPVQTRWIRWVGTARSNPNPLGLNGIQVFGTAPDRRPAVSGWTDWTSGGDPVRPLRIADDGTVDVEDGWNLTIAEFAGSDDGAELSAPGVDTSRWLRATVPGTILASLVDRGHLPDPVGGFDNLKSPEALSRNPWWYRRELRLPHRFTGRGRSRIWLEFDGINHHAEIWLNGSRIGEMTHPFARRRFDVTEALDAGGENVLAVRIDPMEFPGSPGDKGADGVPYADAGSGIMMRNAPTYLAVSGWDWMPAVRDRVMGIWNHVRLRATGDVLVGDPLVRTVLPDADRSVAEVSIDLAVHNAAAGDREVTLTAELAGATVRRTLTVAPGDTDVSFTPDEFDALRLAEPDLWWPNGYGDPTLHELTVTATVAGSASDRRTTSVGLRQVAYESENPIVFDPGANRVDQQVDLPPQQARWVRIVGTRRATGFGISLWALAVRDSADPGADLAAGCQASASSQDNDSNPPANAVDGDPQTRWSSAYADNEWIAVDLGAAVAFDRLDLTWETAYALTFTVQVSADGQDWTDVAEIDNRPRQLRIVVNGVPVLCRGGNWGWDELLRRMGNGRMEAVVGYHRDMNFTMIRNWLGSSDREEFYAECDRNGLLVWNDFPNAWFLDPPDHQVYLDQARETVRRYRSHPCLVVWCGANEGTPSGEVDSGAREIVAAEHPDVIYISNSAGGIVSGGGPYAWVDPQQYFSAELYGQKTFGFHTEIGIPTIPVVESMRHLVGDEPGWPIGTVWNHHDWSTRGNQYPQSYQGAIDERFGESASLEEFCERAQFVNYESMRAMFEAWNAHLWQDATGLLLWMSNPAWHSTVWQTYDYDLDVNGSYYGSRSGCEPLHVQADPRSGAVIALNHTAEPRTNVEVRAELLDLSGAAIASPITATVDLPAADKTDVFTISPPSSSHKLHLQRLTLTDSGGTVLAENTYWRYRDPGDMQILNTLSGAQLRIANSAVRRADGRWEATVDLHNDGDTVAPLVRMSLRDSRSEERVLPTVYSDNYFWLVPGEQRRIVLSCPATGRSPETLEVSATAYRTPPVTQLLS